jgi:hypothetical protein
MRLAPRFAAAITVLVLTVAGCGGAEVVYREVPGGPVELEVPGEGTGFAGAATPTPTAEADATETPDADAEPDATAEPQATAAPDTGTDDGTGDGTEAPPADDATNDTPPPAGSPQEQFEDYCAENPGAC